MDETLSDAPTSWPQYPYSLKAQGISVTNCEAEPIQTPGCIQPHGVLLVLRMSDFSILQVTENCSRLLGAEPAMLLSAPIRNIIGPENELTLRTMLTAEDLHEKPHYLCRVSIPWENHVFDVVIHEVEGLLLVEMELVSPDTFAHEQDYFPIVRKTIRQLQDCSGLRELSQVLTENVHIMTGLDRVMIYKFHPDESGEVIAESRNPDVTAFLGLRYPAYDIPQSTRHIFQKIWIRPLNDADGAPQELVPLINPDTRRALPMIHCQLRGASVMYTEYLKNMGVSASLTMSLRQGGTLWGLIVGHHQTPTSFPHQMRLACEAVAQVASTHLRAAEEREHLAYSLKLEKTHQLLIMQAAHHGLEALTTGLLTLLDGISCGGAAVFHTKRWWKVGITPSDTQLSALSAWLKENPQLYSHNKRRAYITDALYKDYPKAQDMAEVASGLIAIPFAPGASGWILWFRPEVLQTVSWGGDPHTKPQRIGPHGPRLTPRQSFAVWSESVRLQSQPWQLVEVESASDLRVQLLEIVVKKSEQLADLNEQLVRVNQELDAFTQMVSYDLKEPLRGIQRLTQHLLEDASAIIQEKRPTVLHILRLAKRMDNLIDALLQFSQVGRSSLKSQEILDLHAVLEESMDMLGVRLTDPKVKIRIPRPLPKVVGNRVMVREIFFHLLQNAIKYTTKNCVHIEIGYLAPTEAHSLANEPSGAATRVIFYIKDDGIGIDPKDFERIFQVFRRLHGRREYGGGAGIGLCIVKKIVERLHGSIWVQSALGHGSTFYFTLQSDTEASHDAEKNSSLDQI